MEFIKGIIIDIVLTGVIFVYMSTIAIKLFKNEKLEKYERFYIILIMIMTATRWIIDIMVKSKYS